MPSLDFTLLPIGGTWRMRGQEWAVVKVTDAALTLTCNGKRTRLNVCSKGWDAFVRDVEGLVIGGFHGADVGCLAVVADHYRRTT
jgi:hypothetical protein